MSLYIKHNGWQNGGYPFTDPRTGMKFGGLLANLRNQAAKVVLHRRANPAIYNPADLRYLKSEFVELEIQEQICAKRPELCREGPNRQPAVRIIANAVPTVCPKCNGPVSEKTCPTCSGRRVTGWYCATCKLTIRRR